MFRRGASLLAPRSLPTPAVRPPIRFHIARPAVQSNLQFRSVTSSRPQIPSIAKFNSIQTTLLRRTLSQDQKQAEKKYAQEKIKPTPETVSSTSSIHPILGEVGVDSPAAKEVDMGAGIKQDLETIRETFSLTEVPRQAYYVGLAGVLPYLATSLSTVACAYEINHSVAGYGYLMSSKTAETMLQILEPLQIGYGAVILSFLGAIHWGLEWAGYGGYQGYNRYAIGVFSTAVAWPTVLMPIEYALITQFCAFTMLYYVDTRATYKGWTPPWYAIYRFVLTFIVGASIVVSLIGRGEIADDVGRIPGPLDRARELRENTQEIFSKEEEGIRAQQAAENGGESGESSDK